MKICVSSKTLQMQIRRALDNKVETFCVGYKNQYISFDGISEVIPLMTSDRHKDDYIGKMQPGQWFKILEFLRQFEDQPMVMEFTHYMHTEVHKFPEIIISQISKKF